MLQVEQWTLRSRIEMTGAGPLLCARDGRGPGAEQELAERGFAGSVMPPGAEGLVDPGLEFRA